MCSKTGGVPFHGTKEQEEALLQVIAELKDDKGALMPILQKAQEIYGYLPIEVQTMIQMRRRFRWRNIWSCNVLFTIYAQSKGKISHFSLSWHGMLCKRFRGYL
mgnify:CR=1 FL=1